MGVIGGYREAAGGVLLDGYQAGSSDRLGASKEEIVFDMKVLDMRPCLVSGALIPFRGTSADAASGDDYCVQSLDTSGGSFPQPCSSTTTNDMTLRRVETGSDSIT